MASIDQLKSLISSKGGVARSNLFKVFLPNAGSDMNILCREVNLPSRQTLSRERVYGLQRRKVAYGFAQEEVTLTSMLLNNYGAKKYFEDWKQRVVNQNTFEINYHSDYVESVTILQLDKNENPVYGCTLLEAYPTTMNTIQLNNEQDGLVEINVQLSYTNWTSKFFK